MFFHCSTCSQLCDLGKWKKEEITKEQFKKIAKECREKLKKAKAQNELMLAREVKNNTKRVFLAMSVVKRKVRKW